MLASALILLQKIINPDRNLYYKNHDGNDCAKNLRRERKLCNIAKTKIEI